MDSIISSALEEICSNGTTGLSLSSLWAALDSPSVSLKTSIYLNLLKVPALQFKVRNKVYDPNDAEIRRFEDAERIDLMIVANEQLRDNFVGLYDAPSSTSPITMPQRRALERLAIARTNGITQSQLAKEFNMEGKNLFYIVRNLECRGLIVRQPAVVRTKEPGSEGESKNISCVTTNMMYLYRYAKHLRSQQIFEINKEELAAESLANGSGSAARQDGFVGESVKEDVLVKDYLPAMKAVCDTLKEANEKVLVVSDIKRELGYIGSPSGHRTWRTICRRLKDSGFVEEFDAKLNDKVERCLRLLKEFSPKNFEPKAVGGNFDEKHHVKFGRRPQKADQLMELPIEHQIHDMVDTEGSEGLAVMEVCERLGIDKKRNYSRFCNMFSRFGMHLQAENHKRTVAFRVWTSGNSNPESSGASSSLSKVVHCEHNTSYLDDGNLDLPDKSPQPRLEYDHSIFGGDFASPVKNNDSEADADISHVSPGDGKANQLLLCHGSLQELSPEQRDAELDIVCEGLETNVVPSATPSLAFLKSATSGVFQTNPCQALTTDAARREQRILERLQDEKFILRPELFRWLMDLERDKSTSLDRKTIIRTLNKLQQQGHCKCMHINVPVVTNCGRSRITQVVLHPIIQSLSPQLLGEIHDRLRSFEMQSRGQGSSRCKNNDSVPVLNGVQRTQIPQVPDAKAGGSEAMRANGFVLAKMVRAKLLHSFLWGYLSSSPGWDDALFYGKNVHDRTNLHFTCNLFSLEAVIKAIPVELFLQVVGSTQKFDDMIDKCKRDLRLSDIPLQEYRNLMDTHATGRLSKIVDILRRLKLIRLVNSGHSDNGAKVSHADLTHAMELKPYIEEPSSAVATSILRSHDLHPRIRHDFILSNREAVNQYWQTLEYCYAAADPRSALHSFPGSAVHEVFFYRSWASVRVMTADQRAELRKRMVQENPNEKLSYKECEKIAKELNLSLEQVLRVHYDKHQRCLTRASSQKRKGSLEASYVKVARVDSAIGDLDRQMPANIPDTIEHMKKNTVMSYSSGEDDVDLSAFPEDEHLESVEELGPNEEDGFLISQHAFSKMKPRRQKRFSWTDEADRKLLIQYVRQRAALGAKFHRIDWASLPGIPAPPSICARRMSSLKRNTKFRKALMKLCNMLSKRYAKHLEKTQNRSLDDDDDDVARILVRCSSQEGINWKFSDSVEQNEAAGFEDERWDDFDDRDIRRAFEDVLLFKQMAKLEASKRVGTASVEWSDLNVNAEGYNVKGFESVSSTTRTESIQSLGEGQYNVSSQRSRGRRFHRKFVKLLNEGTSVNRQMHESLAVSNAIELFKLVFLSSSSASELPNLLAETLRRYSEHDLFAAFSYLREKKIMIGGTGSQPFVLSQQFLHSVSRSPFPTNSGKRAAEFCGWLHENEKDLMEGGINISADLQCGDIFHLFSLVSSGELSISPCLPDEGVGEAEDLRSLKRKSEDIELCDREIAKKMKNFAECELVSRREKGFPGIMVSVSHATISTTNTVELFKGGDTGSELNGNDDFGATTGQKLDSSSSHYDYMNEILNFGDVVPIAAKSPWEGMVGYARYLIFKHSDKEHASLLNTEIFRASYTAIQRAGDQGLSIEEIAQVVDMPGENIAEYIIDVLQAFGRALKVNAYDSVRVVDTLYRSKYFLTSMAEFPGRIDDGGILDHENDIGGANSQSDLSMNVVDVHKVTILNLPEETAVPLDEVQTSTVHKGYIQEKDVLLGANNDGDDKLSSKLCVPILPWINGDGTINKLVYNGLIRRVFGTVMLNPGILEVDIISQMDVLNPQSCRKLLELMILDKHLIVREMHESTSCGPPTLFASLFGSSFKSSQLVCRQHFFANPMSTSIL
ncbi:B-block_TFIIIC domain-containing protein [Cephalotus follicularis]|uniref:B-block_TFIIIC domain-containing protein n=1 Tax=Cephalotus follicularis TaxID=3775 RepID=A0A1Q3CRI8_CEPFO|nr:B-block_TFIIIC domain-containing protein [Cephalotus follicularis]